jgi:CheY-like chemotaxis protein
MILLIEDRYKRQQNFIQDTSINLDDYSDILDNYTNDREIEFFQSLQNDSFDFSQYDYIISHKSAFNDENSEFKSLIENACKKYNKPLIYFSGGISVNYYNNDEIELLETNSKTFYSHNLQIFLQNFKNNTENILMLCYGENWEKDIVLNLLEKLNLFLNTTEEKKFLYTDLNDAEIDLEYLDKIDYIFYQMQIENDWIKKDELEKLKTSLYDYFTSINKNHIENSKLLISKDNTFDELFDCDIYFDLEDDDIDKYITDNIIPQIKEQNCDVIFIKDNLSEHYLELYGLRVAYHIRLSSELGDKRYLPIVIISDLDSHILNKLDPMAKILFTKNIFIVKNEKKAIENISKKEFKNLTIKEYQEDFLNLIDIAPPKDYLSHHSIANEWAIFKWADFTKAKSEAITINKNKISSMLYFKYLIAKNDIKEKNTTFQIKPKQLKQNGKILLIDDEWDKGWGDILENIFIQNENIKFDILDYNFKDKELTNYSYMRIDNKIKEYNPDVIILDLRLLQNDHDEDTKIDKYSGIKILQKIHAINAGIQVIMLTATSKSTILEKLYDYKILGYIKKEHPEDNSISTKENVNKLVSLVDKGLEDSYLKEIWDIDQELINLSLLDITFDFDMDEKEKRLLELKNTIPMVFEILNSSTSKRFVYSMFTIFKCLEIIADCYIYERNNQENNRTAYWIENGELIGKQGNTSIQNKLIAVKNKFNIDEISNNKISELVRSRNYAIHPPRTDKDITRNCREIVIKNPNKDNIIDWFRILQQILFKIN